MKPGKTARPRLRPALAAVVGVVLSVALLAGCGPVTPQEAARARAATSGPVGPMSFQLPARPSGFDPFAAMGTADQLLAAAQFEPLVSAVEGRVMPRMADWWAMVGDNKKLVITIKHDRWSDDVRMGSDDLVFTLEAHLRPDTRSPLLPALLQIHGAQEFHEGRAPHVAGIVAETSRGVVITLTEPNPNFLAQLTGVFVLPRHVYADQDLDRAETFRRPEVGSGAYLYHLWEGPDQVVLQPNPQVKPHTRLDKVVAKVVGPNEVVPALQRGELDVVVDIPSGQLTSVPEGYRVLRAPGDSAVGLSGRGRLAQTEVRQAIAYALDRQGILANELGGNGRVVDSILLTPDWAASPDRVRRDHDPSAARELLAAAGWSASTPLRLVALTDDADRAVWDAVIADLADVGVAATITVRPVADRSVVWSDAGVEGVIETYRLPVSDPVHIEPWVTCGVVSGYCNPRLDQLLRQSRSESQVTERQALVWEADLLLSQELPVVPLWVPDAVVVVVEGRVGVSPLLQPVTAMIDFWGPELAGR